MQDLSAIFKPLGLVIMARLQGFMREKLLPC